MFPHYLTRRRPSVPLVPLLSLGLLSGLACGGDDAAAPPDSRAPEAVGSIPAQSLLVGETVAVDASPFFRDPDGDALAYAATSSATAVASVSMQGAVLTVVGAGEGMATITVTATDPAGGSATQNAEVAVEIPNRAPEAAGSIPAQSLLVGETVTVDVSSFFTDPDGDELGYAAESSAPSVASAAMSGAALTVAGAGAGSATIAVTATDPDGLAASASVDVTVEIPNRAPEAVGTMSAQSMTVGDTVSVELSPFFSDPDGDSLVYSAMSSAAEVVSASTSGATLNLVGVGAGDATITVTAADPDELTASQSFDAAVAAANRAPEAVGTMPAQSMTVGDTATLDVSPFFNDPDGDPLGYAAVSSETTVVSATMSGNTLTLVGAGEGTAEVTVTASDPDELTASQSFESTVEAQGEAGFIDDFDSPSSLANYTVSDGDAEVVDGMLRIVGRSATNIARADRAADPPVEAWTLKARMGREDEDDTVRLYWFTGDPDYPGFGIILGPLTVGGVRRNYTTIAFDAAEGAWAWLSDLTGTFAGVRDEPGAFTDLAFGWDGQDLYLELGGEEIDQFTPQDWFGRANRQVTSIWLATAQVGGVGLFDRIELTGMSVGRSAVDAGSDAALVDIPEIDPAELRSSKLKARIGGKR